MGNQNITIPLAEANAVRLSVNVPAEQSFLSKDDPDNPGNEIPDNYKPDISSKLGQLVTVHLALTSTSTESIIRYTKDGTTWINFLNGEALTSGSGLERQITLRAGDELNFSAFGTVKLAFCELDLV